MIRDIVIMLLVGGVVRSGSRRVNLLTVVGEIAAGIVIGPSLLKWVSLSTDIEHVATIGVMLLLFNAGMHIDMSDLRKVGRASFTVATTGVALPLASGMLVGLAFGESFDTSLFIGAALAATSIGITARVFSDLGQLDTSNARVVMGAAIIDDLMGLVILAIASVVVQSGSFSVTKLLDTALIIGSFFLGVLVGGTPRKDRVARTISPISQVFILLFFVSIGLRADVSEMASTRGITIALVLSVVAFASKYLAGFSIKRTEVDKKLVGLGMVPRGEVGLIFANTAVGLHVFDASIYSAVVLVVLVTTVVTPALLRRRIDTLNTHDE